MKQTLNNSKNQLLNSETFGFRRILQFDHAGALRRNACTNGPNAWSLSPKLPLPPSSSA
jgi:hypothetical protein